jgi:hypothetical protein
MTALPLNVGPSSWDRDMAGLDEDPNDANLAEIGMHLEGDDKDKKDDDEDEEDDGLDTDAATTVVPPTDDDDDEDDETGVEELDELAELDRLEKEIDTVTEREDFVIEDEI